MSIADTATGTTAHDRPFWRADYARFARAIRRTRHTRDGLTAKSAEHQARCDELAGVVAALFRADAPGAFSGEKFRAGAPLAGALPGYRDGQDDATERRNSYPAACPGRRYEQDQPAAQREQNGGEPAARDPRHAPVRAPA